MSLCKLILNFWKCTVVSLQQGYDTRVCGLCPTLSVTVLPKKVNTIVPTNSHSSETMNVLLRTASAGTTRCDSKKILPGSPTRFEQTYQCD